MYNEISVTGIVLKDSPVGEYDKRISLLTLERGRISAFLRGAKRGKGSPLAGIGPFCFGEFFLREGRNSYTVVRAEISERFNEVQNDLSYIAYGSYFLEVSEYYSRENNDEKERMKLIYQSLRALSSEKFSLDFVLLLFELKTIVLTGEYPNIFECANCKKNENLYYFSFDKRVCYCKNCRDKGTNLYTMSQALSYSLWFIFTTPTEKLFSFKLSDSAMKELLDFTKRYKARYMKHPFKTYEMIDMLTNLE